MPNLQQGTLQLPDGARISYLTGGEGTRPLVFLPGAGDGLATACELSGRLTGWLRGRFERFHVLYVSRREPLTRQVSLRQQARDVAYVMEQLGWPASLIEAQSAGGPIGQWLAVERPELVSGLVLSSTAAWLDAPARAQVEAWLEMVQREDWDAFFASAASLFWRDERAAMLRPFLRLLCSMARPAAPARLEVILGQLLELDHRDLLGRITAPTLVTGGLDDRIFSPALQREMAARIPRATVTLHDSYGHGNDLENPEHVRLLTAFARLSALHQRQVAV